MKKKVLLFFATMFINICMAQSVKTYSIYDTNQSGDINIADVTTEVDKVKSNVSATSAQQFVTADDLSTLIIDLKSEISSLKSDLKSEISSLKNDLKLMKEKLGISEGDTPSEDTHEYVDLGLPSGTLWATCNVGADKPEEYGLYFAWGETTGYTSNTSDGHAFDWVNYKWCNGTSYMTKYCIHSGYGTIDNKAELEAADDAATANWGSEWQMPSREQITELINSSNTTTEWTHLNGLKGWLITSKTNGNTLFLPATNYPENMSYYWARTLDSGKSVYACCISFNSSSVNCGLNQRYLGLSVRPVRVQK